jgi:hypothetical protein
MGVIWIFYEIMHDTYIKNGVDMKKYIKYLAYTLEIDRFASYYC